MEVKILEQLADLGVLLVGLVLDFEHPQLLLLHLIDILLQPLLLLYIVLGY